MPYEEKLDIKCCVRCKEKKLLNQWDMCEYCSSRNLELIFTLEGKVLEKNNYNGSQPKEVDHFTQEQVIEFLIKELMSHKTKLKHIKEVVGAYQQAVRSLENL